MKSKYQFAGKRYTTKRIQNEIEPLLQLYLWDMIDTQRKAGKQMDYLQIFTLKASVVKNGKPCQELIHSHEIPKREIKEALLFVQEPVNAKVYVIDDIENVIMLLAEEY